MKELDYENWVCKRKVCYPTHNDAKFAAKRMQRRHRARFSAYKCPVCSLYHVGHSIKQPRKDR